MSVTAPGIGELVRVCGHHWVVTGIHTPDPQARADRGYCGSSQRARPRLRSRAEGGMGSRAGRAALTAQPNSLAGTVAGFNALRLGLDVPFEEGWHVVAQDVCDAQG